MCCNKHYCCFRLFLNTQNNVSADVFLYEEHLNELSWGYIGSNFSTCSCYANHVWYRIYYDVMQPFGCTAYTRIISLTRLRMDHHGSYGKRNLACNFVLRFNQEELLRFPHGPLNKSHILTVFAGRLFPTCLPDCSSVQETSGAS